MVEYEYALDKSGDPIHIKDAVHKMKYYCPDCESELIPRKGDINAYHYAHKNIDAHAGGGIGAKESALHSNSKCFVYDLLKNAIKSRRDIKLLNKCPFDGDIYDDNTFPRNLDTIPSWSTQRLDSFSKRYPRFMEKIKIKARDTYFYNITGDIDEVVLEKQDKSGYIPDVSLLNNGKLVKVIEIVHTHDDSEEKTNFYQNNGIDVIKVFVPSEKEYRLLKRSTIVFPHKITDVFLYSGGCNIPFITTKQMLISNLFIRKIRLIESEFNKVGNLYGDLICEYSSLLVDVNACISKIEESKMDMKYACCFIFNQMDYYTISYKSLSKYHLAPIRKLEDRKILLTTFFSLMDINYLDYIWIHNTKRSLEKTRTENESIENEIRGMLNGGEFGPTWTIYGICRHIQSGSFNKTVSVFKHLIDTGKIIRHSTGYRYVG